jgi:hypothetical protein
MAKQSDRELRYAITVNEKRLAKTPLHHADTRKWIEDNLARFRALLAMPKAQRPDYKTGNL